MKQLTTQKHYTVPIQPVEYIKANHLDFFEGNIVKYITRRRNRDGVKDILKVIDYACMILKDDYNIISEIKLEEKKHESN